MTLLVTLRVELWPARFSSNMNRVQMIINAAAAAGRKVALDGRGMMSYAEIAVRQGILKVPKGTVVPMQQVPSLPEEQTLVIFVPGAAGRAWCSTAAYGNNRL